MKSETVPRRLSKDIFCASSDLSSRSNAGGSGTCKANNISGPNAKFTIINHSTDRHNNLLFIKLDFNSVHEECKGSKLPGSKIGESS
jgi:hypothetical protein